MKALVRYAATHLHFQEGRQAAGFVHVLKLCLILSKLVVGHGDEGLPLAQPSSSLVCL